MPVFFVACPATFRGEIKLVPQFELSLWRQRRHSGFLVADQITADGDEGLAALRPEPRDDVSRARPPIKTGDGRLLELQTVHQGAGIDGECRGLAIAERVARKKTCRAIAAQVRDNRP